MASLSVTQLLRDSHIPRWRLDADVDADQPCGNFSSTFSVESLREAAPRKEHCKVLMWRCCSFKRLCFTDDFIGYPGILKTE